MAQQLEFFGRAAKRTNRVGVNTGVNKTRFLQIRVGANARLNCHRGAPGVSAAWPPRSQSLRDAGVPYAPLRKVVVMLPMMHPAVGSQPDAPITKNCYGLLALAKSHRRLVIWYQPS